MRDDRFGYEQQLMRTRDRIVFRVRRLRPNNAINARSGHGIDCRLTTNARPPWIATREVAIVISRGSLIFVLVRFASPARCISLARGTG
jgi:hypothetical protein